MESTGVLGGDSAVAVKVVRASASYEPDTYVPDRRNSKGVTRLLEPQKCYMQPAWLLAW